MTKIAIPAQFEEKLSAYVFEHRVRQAVEDFAQWIGDPAAQLFFFPEYTDHGAQHVSSVLSGAAWLIREEAWTAFTAEDAAVLILATLLHDSAMHLTADGFLTLLEKNHAERWPGSTMLDRMSWADLFDAYMEEARRWDQRKLHRILGDYTSPPEKQPDLVDYIRHPKDLPAPDRWPATYRKFLGEFVRRYHPRIAHEIALDSVPGSSPVALQLEGVPLEIRDLAGLIARSHGCRLRELFGYLQLRYYSRVTCFNCHPIFLAVLLRIADYLEIRSDRVNPIRPKLQRLRSPISVEEWSTHLAVHDVRHPHDDDAEALFVIARPTGARDFLRLQQLLTGLQQELDTSWAVLGEVFSKQGLSGFGLTLRRVRSNLDDPDEFVARENPSYFPIQAAFATAGADLLKLLVEPLYGDRPEIGVRELLQNAVDAVLELRQYAADRGDPQLTSIPLPPQEADVLITIDRTPAGEVWLTITDKGIGMTAGTVRDYFLKAGASFRTSDAWRRDFESQGQSKILRSGRFGVGALAAFLLGPRLEVWTRHASEPVHSGIHFTAALADDIVDLFRVRRDHVGTSIRITLPGDWKHDSDSDFQDDWDWFTLDSPKVERRVDGKRLNQRYHFPAKDTPRLPPDWRSLANRGLDIHWSYSDAASYKSFLTCNGIRIGDGLFGPRVLLSSWPFPSPLISVFDPNGRLPFDLRRDGLERPLPFEDELMSEIARDLLAFLLVHSPEVPAWRKVSFPHALPEPWIHIRGTSLPYYWHIKKAEITSALCLFGAPCSDLLIPENTGIFFNGDAERLLRLSGSHERQMFRVADPKVSLLWGQGMRSKPLDREWCLFDSTVPGGRQLLEVLHRDITRGAITGISAAYEYQIDPARVQVPQTLFTELLDEILDSPIIPFDQAVRRQELAGAFAELRDYVKVWEQPDLTGWRRGLIDAIRSQQSR